MRRVNRAGFKQLGWALIDIVNREWYWAAGKVLESVLFIRFRFKRNFRAENDFFCLVRMLVDSTK